MNQQHCRLNTVSPPETEPCIEILRWGQELIVDEESEIVNGLLLELRRGVIVLSVLSQLEEPKYGYSLMQSMEEKGVPVDAGTLYPLLRRLEKQKLLHSEWETGGAKPRKYYVLADTGRSVYQKLCREWAAMAKNMNRLINEKEAPTQ